MAQFFAPAGQLYSISAQLLSIYPWNATNYRQTVVVARTIRRHWTAHPPLGLQGA